MRIAPNSSFPLRIGTVIARAHALKPPALSRLDPRAYHARGKRNRTASGGDTQFVNMHDAYEALPDAVRHRIDGRMARHVYQSRYSERKLPQLAGERRKTVGTATVLHPLVRTHPESGRKALYINPIRIEEIVGMETDEALALLDELLAHSMQARFEYRHKWQPGDTVIWDNRCLLHKANGDYPVSQVRYLYRLMLRGERPA